MTLRATIMLDNGDVVELLAIESTPVAAMMTLMRDIYLLQNGRRDKIENILVVTLYGGDK